MWGENMLGYLPLDIICSSKFIVFLAQRWQKTVRLSEQVQQISEHILAPNEGYCLDIPQF